MHNCKTTRTRLMEEAMSGTPPDQNAIEPDGLLDCAECFAEFESVRRALLITRQTLDGARPEENFWAGYHARLRQSLERDTAFVQPRRETTALSRLKGLFFAQLRVPVPAALALFVVFGLAIVFAARSPRASTIAGPSAVVTKTIEVPVIQERLVTRIVYRTRPQDRSTRPFANVVRRRNSTIEPNPASLSGFEPANEARLTIIKGSYQNDK